MVDKMDKMFRNVVKICFYISAGPMITLSLLTVLDVGARYILNASISSALDIASQCMSMSISLGMAHVTCNRENFAVKFLTDKVSPTSQAVLDTVTSGIAAGIFYVLAYQATMKAIYSLRVGENIGALAVPVFPARFLFAFGFALSSVALTFHLLNTICGKKPGRVK